MKCPVFDNHLWCSELCTQCPVLKENQEQVKPDDDSEQQPSLYGSKQKLTKFSR